jgi:type II secretory pathway component GspD/PulD (secretin)
MRIFYLIPIFLCCILSVTLAQPCLGQTHLHVLGRPVSLSVSNVSIEEVLQDISRQTGVDFSYSTHVLPAHEKVSLTFTSQTLAQVLNTLLEERNLTYSVTGKRVVIRRKKMALTQTIQGTVIDHASKAPITGANILIMGLEPVKGSSTDEKGNFRIEEVPIGRKSLKVSHVGYETIILPELLIGTGKENIITVQLTELISSISEVIITDEAVRMESLNEMAAVSTKLLPMTVAKRYASSLQDRQESFPRMPG